MTQFHTLVADPPRPIKDKLPGSVSLHGKGKLPLLTTTHRFLRCYRLVSDHTRQDYQDNR